MIECHRGAHGVAEQKDVLSAEPSQQRLQVVIEGAESTFFGVVRVAMTAKVESVDRPLDRDLRC